MNKRNSIFSIFSSLAFGGVATLIYFGHISFPLDKIWSNKKISKKPKNYFGRTPRYKTQLNSLDQSTLSHIPFYKNETDVENSHGETFILKKEDLVFFDTLSKEEKNVSWSCEVETSDEFKPHFSASEIKDRLNETSCRFFVLPTVDDEKNCSFYQEDLTFFSFKNLYSKQLLPPKILVFVEAKLIYFNLHTIHISRYVTKVTLKKNAKDYLSFDTKKIKKNYSCRVRNKKEFSHFLVQAVEVADSEKTSEQLFKKENGINKKNYVCKSDYFLTNNNQPVNIREEDRECSLFEFQNNNNNNISNLSQYVSDLVSSNWEKEKDNIVSGKFYILKINRQNIYPYIYSSPVVYKSNTKDNPTFDNSHIRLYYGKRDEKSFSRFKLVAKIEATENEKNPNIYHAKHYYRRKLFIAKVKDNQIIKPNTGSFKCSFLFLNTIATTDTKWTPEDCKIYKFDKELSDLNNLSFNKPLKEVTDLSKTNIKNGNYYIIDYVSDEWTSTYQNQLSLDEKIEGLDISLSDESTQEKVIFTLQTQFFGDYKKEASEKNKFFLFKEGEKLPPKPKKGMRSA